MEDIVKDAVIDVLRHLRAREAARSAGLDSLRHLRAREASRSAGLDSISTIRDYELDRILNQLQPQPMYPLYGPMPKRRSSVAKMGGRKKSKRR